VRTTIVNRVTDAPSPGPAVRGLRRAFTFTELMVTVAVLGIVLAVVAPALTPEGPARLTGAATLVASDVEYAQSLSVANPDDLAVVRFEPAAPEGPTYWIALLSTPETPVTRPDSTEPYHVVFGEGDAAQLEGVAYTTTGVAGGMIVFDEFGRLGSADPVSITLSNASGDMTVAVSPDTGFVSIE